MAVKLLFTMTALAVLGSHGICFAWLGEAEADVRKHYGEAKFEQPYPRDNAPAEKELSFVHEDMQIIVTIHRGRSVAERYTFKDSISDAMLPKMDEILKGNSQNLRWLRIQNPSKINPDMGAYGWMRDDRAAKAVVWRSSPDTLEVVDSAFAAEVAQTRGQ